MEFSSRQLELLGVAINSEMVKSNYKRVIVLIPNEIPEATLEVGWIRFLKIAPLKLKYENGACTKIRTSINRIRTQSQHNNIK